MRVENKILIPSTPHMFKAPAMQDFIIKSRHDSVLKA